MGCSLWGRKRVTHDLVTKGQKRRKGENSDKESGMCGPLGVGGGEGRCTVIFTVSSGAATLSWGWAG